MRCEYALELFMAGLVKNFEAKITICHLAYLLEILRFVLLKHGLFDILHMDSSANTDLRLL